MRAFWAFVIILGLSLVWVGDGSATAKTNSQSIIDVSWPNCTLNLPTANAGIVGVTGGLVLRPNPCLAKEAANYRNLSVYLNTGYAGIKKAIKFQNSPKRCAANNEKCLAYNYGYNNGLYAIKYALLSGVVADRWWLDVETENSWDDNIQINRASLQGNLDAIASFVGKDRTGFYSYPGQWNLLTGEWRNNYPVWVATGSTHLIDAQLACNQKSFTGGQVLLGQYTPNLDQNIICR